MRLDTPEGIERHATERRDNGSRHLAQRRLEERRAGRDLTREGTAVRPSLVGGVAEEGVRDEHLVAPQPRLAEQRLEPFARAIAEEWHARARRTVAARRLTDHEQRRVERPFVSPRRCV